MAGFIPGRTRADGVCCRKSAPRGGFRVTQSERIVAKRPPGMLMHSLPGPLACLPNTFPINGLGRFDRCVA